MQIQRGTWILAMATRCDLLKFMYLCWCSYNYIHERSVSWDVVICWNLCTFAGAVTTLNFDKLWKWRCDLLKFMYLCWCSYNFPFVLSNSLSLWFAEIYVPLLVQLQRLSWRNGTDTCCDLLKFMYLCWCSYNLSCIGISTYLVVICWNLCTFAGAVTTRKVGFPPMT